jgi:single-stranded DNA-binding protein
MLTVHGIGVVAKTPNELKEDDFGTLTRWLWVKFQMPSGNGVLYLNVVTTGDTAIAAGELAKGARVRIRGALASRRFKGEDEPPTTVVEADEVTPEPAAEKAQAGRRTRS